MSRRTCCKCLTCSQRPTWLHSPSCWCTVILASTTRLATCITFSQRFCLAAHTMHRHTVALALASATRPAACQLLHTLRAFEDAQVCCVYAQSDRKASAQTQQLLLALCASENAHRWVAFMLSVLSVIGRQKPKLTSLLCPCLLPTIKISVRFFAPFHPSGCCSCF